MVHNAQEDSRNRAAVDQLGSLIDRIEDLRIEVRTSPEWMRWRINCLDFLERVFGRGSRSFKYFQAIEWQIQGGVLIDPDEMSRDRFGNLEGTNAFIERMHQQAAVRGLDRAKGILQSAMDELSSKGASGVYANADSGAEASDLLRVIKLAERQWRKVVRTRPEREVDVQDAFEAVLVGAELPYSRESESFPFGAKSYKPDFVIPSLDLVVEIKLCKDLGREKELNAEIGDDILAYRTRYKNILFAIYDLGIIRDVERLAVAFESEQGVMVRVVKH